MIESWRQFVIQNDKSCLIIGLLAIIVLITGIMSPIIPVVFFLLLVFLIIIKDHRFGTLILIILTFTNVAAQKLTETYHIMLLLTAITLFSLMLSFLRGKIQIKGIREFNFLLIIFAVWAFLSGILAIDHTLWIASIYEMTRAFLLLYLIYNSFSKKEEVLFIFKISVLSLFISSLASFLFTGGLSFNLLASFFMTRFTGSALDPNYYAMTVAAVIPLAFVATTRESHMILRFFWILSALFLIFTVIISQSRTGLLSISVVFFYTMIYLLRRKRKEALFVLIPVIIIVLMLPSYTWHRLFLFLNTILTGVRSDISVTHRFALLGAAFDVFIKNPIFGVGLWNFQIHAPHYTPYPMIAHNTYLEIASGLGLLGLIPFLMILHRGFIISKKAMNEPLAQELAWALSAALLGMFISMFFLSVPFKLDLWVMFGLAAVIGKK